jgi:hypothetical protein
LNTYIRNAMFLILLASAVALLPACASKTNVNSEKPPETVLNPEETPVPSVSHEKQDIGNPTSSYTENLHRTKGANSTTTVSTTPVSANSLASTPVAATTPLQTPMDTTAPVQRSGGSHWFLWLLVILVLGGIGWYFWSKSQSDSQTPIQPLPPTGGLSPVSGFTAVKEQIEDEVDSKPSFWSQKLF